MQRMWQDRYLLHASRSAHLHCLVVVWSLFLVASIAGCATPTSPSLSSIEPLSTTKGYIYPYNVNLETPDFLGLDEDMRQFVARATANLSNARQRLTMLHQGLVGSGGLRLDYNPQSDRTAAEVFHRGEANCLSYAHLLIALAREAGLDARYQWVDVRPEWSRLGRRLALQLHVNVVVKLDANSKVMVDINSLQPRQIVGSRLLKDNDGAALHHNNLAMHALAAGNIILAYKHEVRALQYSPKLAHLWVNLGAIYRAAGQLHAAEHSYQIALDLESDDRAAMQNLALLYEQQGRYQEEQFWAGRLTRYRAANPYYHAWQGGVSAKEQDWSQAAHHYSRALALRDDDARLHYELSIIKLRLGDPVAATRSLRKAIKFARLARHKKYYRSKLSELSGQLSKADEDA